MGIHPMDNTTLYKLWQAPFHEQKLAPVLRRLGPAAGLRVLDVGCGPGTNAHHFLDSEYLGVDINTSYIRDAERRFGPRFRVADVTTMRVDPGGGFDCILLNSLLHHLPDSAVEQLLAHLATLLTDAGTVHILDLVLPEHLSMARLLARLDRGLFPRPLARWQEMFAQSYSPVVFEPYPLKVLGVTLWSMVYFQGRRSRCGR